MKVLWLDIIKTIKKLIPANIKKVIHSLQQHYVSKVEIKKDLKEYIKMNTRETFKYDKSLKFFINEKKESAGAINQYYWQDLWAATKIIKNRPTVHYDIGSRIDGFIAHLQAAKQPVTLLDVRPMEITLPYVNFVQTDATNLNNIDDNSIESLSALCSLEHFGLGRYGDTVDPEACFKAFENIQRVVRGGGHIYISVPIGKEHIEFNAHRVFYIETILKAFNKSSLIELKVNTLEKNMILEDVDDLNKFDKELNRGGRFGLFEFKKL